MPRVGGEFVAPYPDVVPDTTIESAVHNGTVADFVADANAARPITAGGTGAVSAAAARTNLAVEVRSVQVTNYDSHVFESGSFWSNSTALAAPIVGHGFVGTAVVYNVDYIVIEARNLNDTETPGIKYVRERLSGAWGTWTVDGAGQYVNVTGDTMTGHLALPTGPAANQAVRKDYVDAVVGGDGAVLRIGDVMTGPLVLNFTVSGTDPYEATNVAYVVDAVSMLTARLEALERKIK